MYTPVEHDEITSIVNYVDQQLAALRAAMLGLTEDQVRATPCTSALSIGGILKHVTHGMRGAVGILATPDGGGTGPDQAAVDEYLAGFTLTDEETGASVLHAFDEAREAYLRAIAVADPDGTFLAPPAPWHGIPDARPARLRYYLLHQLEEMARHAGHADIIREQLDGMAVPTLVLTLEGAPANDYFQPYVARPGTIGAVDTSHGSQ